MMYVVEKLCVVEIPFKSELKMTYVMTFNIIDNVVLLALIINGLSDLWPEAIGPANLRKFLKS